MVGLKPPIQVHLSELVPIKRGILWQMRWPRSKKRRIREKWSWRAKNYKRFEVYVMFVPHGGNEVIMHPTTWEEFGIQLWPADAANQPVTFKMTTPSTESPPGSEA